MNSEMTELPVTRHQWSEPRRRWFRSSSLELIVWASWWGWGPPVGFRLVYDKPAHESALTWTKERGFAHQREERGEDDERDRMLRYYDKAAPGMAIDDEINIDRLMLLFEQAAPSLPPKIAALVLDKLAQLKSSRQA